MLFGDSDKATNVNDVVASLGKGKVESKAAAADSDEEVPEKKRDKKKDKKEKKEKKEKKSKKAKKESSEESED